MVCFDSVGHYHNPFSQMDEAKHFLSFAGIAAMPVTPSSICDPSLRSVPLNVRPHAYLREEQEHLHF